MHLRDRQSGRDIWVIRSWPDTPPWSAARFALLVASDHQVDAATIAAPALASGLALAAAWGPSCDQVELAFDNAICDTGLEETVDTVILTTSHMDEAIEDCVDVFLLLSPADAYFEACTAWVILALGDVAANVEAHLCARVDLTAS